MFINFKSDPTGHWQYIYQTPLDLGWHSLEARLIDPDSGVEKRNSQSFFVEP